MTAGPGAPSGATLARAQELLRRRRPAIVAIDGPSGAGKTTLAEALASTWRAAPVLVQLDRVYRGWEGLDAGATELRRHLLPALRSGRPGRIQGWDWAASRVAPASPVLPGRPLIVEGCGAFAAVSGLSGVARILVEAPLGDRRTRALRRDGGAYDPYWALWETQWRRYLAKHRWEAVPDLVVRSRPDVLAAEGPAGLR
ncbi:ATP-binding protein [Agromyces mediolanus]|uniref:ATP-binding protein n=1 Tax=Agromyces mediolanus TaxID=41986 RepID=UPI003836EB39